MGKANNVFETEGTNVSQPVGFVFTKEDLHFISQSVGLRNHLFRETIENLACKEDQEMMLAVWKHNREIEMKINDLVLDATGGE